MRSPVAVAAVAWEEEELGWGAVDSVEGALDRVAEISAEEAWGAALVEAALAQEEASEAVVLAAIRAAALVDRDSVEWEA